MISKTVQLPSTRHKLLGQQKMTVQKFSVFHESTEGCLREWHRPYAQLLSDRQLVLDVGCGPGYFADELSSLDVASIGIDLDPEMVELSNRRGHEAELGDENWLKRHIEEFDAVHISHVVEHLWGDELITMLSNAYGALVPGGLIVIRTPNWENRYVRERLFWMDHTHKRPYPRELLIRILNEIGMMEVVSGREPYGMNDTYVVAEKMPGNKERSTQLVFPDKRKKNVGMVSRCLEVVRQRLRKFLSID